MIVLGLVLVHRNLGHAHQQ